MQQQSTSLSVPHARIPYDLIDDLGLSAHAKLVYLVLARHAHARTREATPSLDHIARLTGLGRTTVCAALNALEALGWVHRSRARGPSCYFVQPSALASPAGRWAPHPSDGRVANSEIPDTYLFKQAKGKR